MIYWEIKKNGILVTAHTLQGDWVRGIRISFSYIYTDTELTAVKCQESDKKVKSQPTHINKWLKGAHSVILYIHRAFKNGLFPVLNGKKIG